MHSRAAASLLVSQSRHLRVLPDMAVLLYLIGAGGSLLIRAAVGCAGRRYSGCERAPLRAAGDSWTSRQ